MNTSHISLTSKQETAYKSPRQTVSTLKMNLLLILLYLFNIRSFIGFSHASEVDSKHVEGSDTTKAKIQTVEPGM